MIKWIKNLFSEKDKYGNPKPPQLRSDLVWVLINEEWHEVCDLCGGNCGQCGITSRVGNIPADMNNIIKKGKWYTGNHYGLGQ